MMIQKTAVRFLAVAVCIGSAIAAHAQTGTAIDVSSMSHNSNNASTSSGGSIGLQGASNPIPGEPGTNVVSIPEPGTGLLALGGVAMFGFAVARRRRK